MKIYVFAHQTESGGEVFLSQCEDLETAFDNLQKVTLVKGFPIDYWDGTSVKDFPKNGWEYQEFETFPAIGIYMELS